MRQIPMLLRLVVRNGTVDGLLTGLIPVGLPQIQMIRVVMVTLLSLIALILPDITWQPLFSVVCSSVLMIVAMCNSMVIL